MTDTTQTTLLRRMLRPQTNEAAESPLTSSRAVRLALTKAANDSIGLVLTVTSVAENVAKLDDMLADLSDDLLLIGLDRAGARIGLVAVDLQLRAAIVEMQTVGALIDQAAAERAPTLTDSTLSEPIVLAFLDAFPAAVCGTTLEGWADGAKLDERFRDVRSAGLVLADCDYRIVRMNVDLGVAERQGQISIVLPLLETGVVQSTAVPDPVNWGAVFQDRVQKVSATLDAQLLRFNLPFSTIEGFKIGQVLPLPGCTVESVQLRAADNRTVAQAKLGQLGGMRAVRLQSAPMPEMKELSTHSAAAPDLIPPDNMPPPDEAAMDLMAAAIETESEPSEFAVDDLDQMADLDAMPDQ